MTGAPTSSDKAGTPDSNYTVPLVINRPTHRPPLAGLSLHIIHLNNLLLLRLFLLHLRSTKLFFRLSYLQKLSQPFLPLQKPSTKLPPSKLSPFFIFSTYSNKNPILPSFCFFSKTVNVFCLIFWPEHEPDIYVGRNIEGIEKGLFFDIMNFLPFIISVQQAFFLLNFINISQLKQYPSRDKESIFVGGKISQCSSLSLKIGVGIAHRSCVPMRVSA